MAMKSIDDNIDSLSRAVMNEARAEADRILAEAREKAAITRKRAEEQAAAERKAILDRARQEVTRLRSQSIATAQLKARTEQLESREKLLNDVFQAARKQLPTVKQWSNYDQTAERLLREALTHLHASRVMVRADAETRQALTERKLDALSKEYNVTIEFGEPLTQQTGVVVESLDGHLNYANTLDTRLSRLQNILRSPVYHILVGETL